MRKLDGSNAGGQFLRTALTLSVLENEPVRLENVRGDRPNPGLANQHLAVLETLAAVADAEVSGAELGAETIEFDPDRSSAGGLEGGSYAVDIGTAGSVTLLFDALLPLATVLEEPLSVTATGGTNVEWSPPLDYFRQIKLPLLGAHGLVASCEVDRRGFYPDGGGRATLRIGPSSHWRSNGGANSRGSDCTRRNQRRSRIGTSPTASSRAPSNDSTSRMPTEMPTTGAMGREGSRSSSARSEPPRAPRRVPRW